MDFTLTQKETMLLEDAKKQEDICIKKYQSFANQAKDPQLKKLLNKLANEEQHHLNIIDALLKGKTPTLKQGFQSQMDQQAQLAQQSGNSEKITFNTAQDSLLCSDLLSTEKFVSGLYDTGIFESSNKQVRTALQHIQRDEQKHGELLFNYMNSNGMYNVK